jgi:hypothetical protein
MEIKQLPISFLNYFEGSVIFCIAL